MRPWVVGMAAACVGLYAVSGSAQGTDRVARSRSMTVTQQAPPAPPPQTSVPRNDWKIGTGSHRFRPPFPPPFPGEDLFLAGPDTYAPRFDRVPRRRGRRYPFFGGFGYGFGYAPMSPFPGPDSSIRRQWEREADGYLRLLMEPATAQVHVDGFYVGTVAEFATAGRALPAGPRRVEVRAHGYQTATFDVNVVPNETITYRQDLARIEQRPAAPVPVAARKTMYVIPRCYAGDTPPVASQLPAGCNARQVRRIPPA